MYTNGSDDIIFNNNVWSINDFAREIGKVQEFVPVRLSYLGQSNEDYRLLISSEINSVKEDINKGLGELWNEMRNLNSSGVEKINWRLNWGCRWRRGQGIGSREYVQGIMSHYTKQALEGGCCSVVNGWRWQNIWE